MVRHVYVQKSNNNAVKENKEDIIENTEDILGNKEDILGNKEDILGNKEDILGNKEDIINLYKKVIVLKGELGILEPEVEPYFIGEWQLAPLEGSLSTGPFGNPGPWFSIDLPDIANKKVLYDDIFKFNPVMEHSKIF